MVIQNTKAARINTIKDLYRGIIFDEFILYNERNVFRRRVIEELNYQIFKTYRESNVRHR